MISQVTSTKDLDLYDQWLKNHPKGNFWQSIERKAYVEALGGKVRIYIAKYNGKIVCSAQVVIDTTIAGLSVWDIPRGPIETESGKWKVESAVEVLMRKIIDDAKHEKCIALYCSPVTEMQNTKYKMENSSRHIHCEATRIIDISQTEEDILAQMKQKGRYNIRLAKKHGIHGEDSNDIDGFIDMVKETAARDKFMPLAPEKYRAFYENLEESFLIMAYSPDNNTKPIAGLLGLIWNNQGIYYYGASVHEHRAFMAPYRIQWRAMRFCKERGCTSYDLLGIAPEGSGPTHPWAGISGFKEKFGGEVVAYPPEQVIILRPFVYWLLQMKRKIFG